MVIGIYSLLLLAISLHFGSYFFCFEIYDTQPPNAFFHLLFAPALRIWSMFLNYVFLLVVVDFYAFVVQGAI